MEEGAAVWVADAAETWVPGRVVQALVVNKTTVTIELDATGRRVSFPKADLVDDVLQGGHLK